MKITKIEIHNYKSIKEPVEINLYNGLPTVLIGKNGSGKTNILEALSAIAEANGNYFGLHKELPLKYKVHDYTGRLMKKSACGNPNSAYHPTLDHIRPLSAGGCDVLENIIICHRDTNEEKADHFPHWKANGAHYHARRVKGSRVEYEIIED